MRSVTETPTPPPPSRTTWTRRVPHPVLIGHAASLTAAQRGGAAGRAGGGPLPGPSAAGAEKCRAASPAPPRAPRGEATCGTPQRPRPSGGPLPGGIACRRAANARTKPRSRPAGTRTRRPRTAPARRSPPRTPPPRRPRRHRGARTRGARRSTARRRRRTAPLLSGRAAGKRVSAPPAPLLLFSLPLTLLYSPPPTLLPTPQPGVRGPPGGLGRGAERARLR